MRLNRGNNLFPLLFAGDAGDGGGGGGGQPGTQPGDQGVTPRTYTEEEVMAKLRGQGKALEETKAELEKLRADAEAAAKAKEEAELSAQERLAKREAELAERDAKLAEYQAREQARVDAIKADNKKRLAALPEEHRPPEVADPEAMAQVLTYAEQRAGNGSPGGVPPLRKPRPDTQAGNDDYAEIQRQNALHMLGIKERRS